MPASTCQVTFRGLQPSPALERLITERTEWLQQFAAITSLHALVDVPHRHQREHTVRVLVRLALTDGPAIAVGRESADGADTLVRDTFDVARRRVQDAIREQRGFVKTHGDDSRRAV